MPHYIIKEIVHRTGEPTGKQIPLFAKNEMKALRFAFKLAKLKDSPASLDMRRHMVYPHGVHGRFGWVARETTERNNKIYAM